MPVNLGIPLVEASRLDTERLRRLQAVGVLSVEDLLSLAASDPDAVQDFLGDIDLRSLENELLPSSPLLNLAGLDFSDVNYHFGAATPAGLNPPHEISGAVLQTTLAQLQVGPETVTPEPARPATVNLSAGMRPVRNQGDRQTCVAHAGVAVLEHLEHAQGVGTTDLSPQHLYYAAKRRDGYPAKSGTLISAAMKALHDEGVCTERDWPYEAELIEGNETHGPPPALAAGAAGDHRAHQVIPIPRRTPSAIQDQLDQGRPVAFSLPIYASSARVKVWTNPLGKIPMPLEKTKHIGNHAICAVGYQMDPTTPGGGWMIVRNSWGTSWAGASPWGAGYGAVPFAYIEQHGLETMTLA